MNKTVLLKDRDGNALYPKTTVDNVIGLKQIISDEDVNVFSGSGSPSSTASYYEGVTVKDFYFDITNRRFYYVKEIDNNIIQWVKFGVQIWEGTDKSIDNSNRITTEYIGINIGDIFINHITGGDTQLCFVTYSVYNQYAKWFTISKMNLNMLLIKTIDPPNNMGDYNYKSISNGAIWVNETTEQVYIKTKEIGDPPNTDFYWKNITGGDMGYTEFDYPVKEITDNTKDGNTWRGGPPTGAAWLEGSILSKGIPISNLIKQHGIEIEFDSVEHDSSFIHMFVGNDQNDPTSSLYQTTITNIDKVSSSKWVIYPNSISNSYKYLFISIANTNGTPSFFPSFTNPLISYKSYETVLEKKTLIDDFALKTEHAWETIGTINKGTSSVSDTYILDFDDILIPYNHDYKAFRILFYINASNNAVPNICFNGSSSLAFWFGTYAISAGDKFYELIIEDDTLQNIDGNKSFYAKASINRVNGYYSQENKFSAFSDNSNNTVANCTSIAVNLNTTWNAPTSGGNNGVTVILQGRR